MASPEELKLEQKSRALQLKEEALTRQAQQQGNTEERIKQHQDSVAKKERANQLKSQDLIQRERKFSEENLQLNKERQSLLQTRREVEETKKKSSVYIIPALLLTCVIAGYFAYDQMNKKQQHFNQISNASKNIDKLADILSRTQNQVMTKSSALKDKKTELEKTKGMLTELNNTSEQLRSEIANLKTNQQTSEAERTTLAESATTLSKQLETLKVQLDDNYLTIDINEAFIEYQDNDIAAFQSVLNEQKKILQLKDENLNEHIVQKQKLEKVIAEKERSLTEKDFALMEKQSSLERLKANFAVFKQEFESTKQENTDLKAETQTKKSKDIEINAREAGAPATLSTEAKPQ